MYTFTLLFNAFCIVSFLNGIDVGIGHTCNTMCVLHDTIITWRHSGLLLFLSLFPFHTCAYVTRMKDNICFYLCSPTAATTRPHTRAYVTRMKDKICFYLCSPTPPTTRSQTCAYVTPMKDNFPRSFEPRHVIPDTRISSGQCPRCDVNVTIGPRDFQGHTK
jgi:hypothetical protein